MNVTPFLIKKVEYNLMKWIEVLLYRLYILEGLGIMDFKCFFLQQNKFSLIYNKMQGLYEYFLFQYINVIFNKINYSLLIAFHLSIEILYNPYQHAILDLDLKKILIN
ncbi:hypothetical protein AsAng_0023130 [Aureispira anguillae]|uniref:Uncharacterized protein n=1 Tax=Aureispira anguillae TaxID=2864201 RepID=A0A915YEJ5_9BACT|nr:hypothetical protein AsAng_0023130 [Aureispira anguillae]